jgi:hypothetical protein
VGFYDPEDDAMDANGNSYVRFGWDANGDGALDNDETVEYSLVDSDSTTPDILDLFIRRPNAGNTRDVLAANIVSLGLAYAYDNDNDGELERDGAGDIIWAVDAGNDNDWDQLDLATGNTSETGTTVDVRTIRAVRIWMLAQSQAPDPNYNDTNTYIVGPHVENPGNNYRHRLLERTVLCRNMGL